MIDLIQASFELPYEILGFQFDGESLGKRRVQRVISAASEHASHYVPPVVALSQFDQCRKCTCLISGGAVVEDGGQPAAYTVGEIELKGRISGPLTIPLHDGRRNSIMSLDDFLK